MTDETPQDSPQDEVAEQCSSYYPGNKPEHRCTKVKQHFSHENANGNKWIDIEPPEPPQPLEGTPDVADIVDVERDQPPRWNKWWYSNPGVEPLIKDASQITTWFASHSDPKISTDEVGAGITFEPEDLYFIGLDLAERERVQKKAQKAGMNPYRPKPTKYRRFSVLKSRRRRDQT